MSNLDILRGKRVLVLASTGGHLTQAVKWHRKLRFAEASTFVTFDTPQSHTLLEGLNTFFVPYIAPRDHKGVVVAIRRLMRLDLSGFDAIVSTGAGIALAGLFLAKVRRQPFYYIESVSRFHGPSLTGRVISRLTKGRCFTQHSSYSGERWKPVESLLGDYSRLDDSDQKSDSREGLRIFATLGTIAPYRFDRLVDSLVAVLKDDDEIVWQLGATDRDDLPGVVHNQLTGTEFEYQVRKADVVVTHAGVGTLLLLLDAGKVPVVMSRQKIKGEHVDDHQQQVTGELQRKELIVDVTEGLTRQHLTGASSSKIVST